MGYAKLFIQSYFLGDEIETRANLKIRVSLRYRFVEKLQTIATKFRQEQESGEEKQILMRQYYDVYSLPDHPMAQKFIGTQEYQAHKAARFPPTDYAIPIAENQAFRLEDQKLRARFIERYKATAALYYKNQPPFEDVLATIATWLGKL